MICVAGRVNKASQHGVRVEDEDERPIREMIAFGLKRAGFDVREAEDFRATSLETLRQMVVAGLGVTLLPELALESPFGSQRGLTIRQFSKPAPSRTVGAVWRKSSTRAPAITAVCEVVDRVMTGKP